MLITKLASAAHLRIKSYPQSKFNYKCDGQFIFYYGNFSDIPLLNVGYVNLIIITK